jgi:hypothetical protein
MKVTLVSALLLASASALADPPAPIEVSVHGPIDPALLSTSIASELARPVTQLPGTAACHAPCLAIAIDDAAATITFTTPTGVTRQRTIALPADRTQWPVLVTLLAGNLVRDEADELLADAPAPPAPPVAAGAPAVPVVGAPAPAAPVPAAGAPDVVIPHVAPAVSAPTEMHERISPFAFGLVPGVSTDLFDIQRSHAISIGLVAGSSDHVRGVALSGAVDVARVVSGGQIAGAVAVSGAVSGVQIAGAATFATHASGGQIAGAAAVAGESRGMQIAGAAAVADESRGTQIAGAVSIAHESRGTQIAGAVSIARESLGTQIAGGVTVARETRGTQIAGGVAIANDSRGVQIAGAANIASASAGTQIAGGVNVAGHATGLQLAPINIARRNDGLQIGVINIGGGPDGESFGLLNIVPGGRTDLEAAIDSDRTGTVLLRHGGRHWHNVYGIAGQTVDERAGMSKNDDVWMYGLGLGPSFRLAGLPTDLEAMAWHVSHGGSHDSHLSLLNQLRLTIAIPLGTASIIAGGAINTYVTTDHDSPLVIARTTGEPMSNDVVVKVWPTLFVGLRI